MKHFSQTFFVYQSFFPHRYLPLTVGWAYMFNSQTFSMLWLPSRFYKKNLFVWIAWCIHSFIHSLCWLYYIIPTDCIEWFRHRQSEWLDGRMIWCTGQCSRFNLQLNDVYYPTPQFYLYIYLMWSHLWLIFFIFISLFVTNLCIYICHSFF